MLNLQYLFRSLNPKGINELVNFFEKKLHYEGWIQIAHDSEETIRYDIVKNGNFIDYYLPNVKTSKEKLIKFLKSYLRQKKSLSVLFKNSTEKILDNQPVCEIWGIRLMILDNTSLMEMIPLMELYEAYTTDINTGNRLPTNKYTIFCGEEGCINGWEKCNSYGK